MAFITCRYWCSCIYIYVIAFEEADDPPTSIVPFKRNLENERELLGLICFTISNFPDIFSIVYSNFKNIIFWVTKY